VKLTLGVDYDLPPIPLVEEQTRWFAAGSLLFGLEDRVLDAAAIAAAFTEDQRAASRIDDVQPGAMVDDGGLSIHVCDGASRRELLRFDCFAETPHYHYINANGGNRAVAFDPVANGDMVEWVATCVRTRLGEMLEQAGATNLASAIDPVAVDSALEALMAGVQLAQGEDKAQREDQAQGKDQYGQPR
jgi:hypothetical protein